MNFDEAASAAGWELDISLTTENSNDTWYRHRDTFALKREDTLRDELEEENRRDEKRGLYPHYIDVAN